MAQLAKNVTWQRQAERHDGGVPIVVELRVVNGGGLIGITCLKPEDLAPFWQQMALALSRIG